MRYPSRREMLRTTIGGLGAMLAGPSLFFMETRGAFAEELTRTPAQTEGPFYPRNLPLDTDNDLLIINDAITPAVGEITHLSGRILDANGDPIRNAHVEIWQVDNNGAYLHEGTANAESRDKNFQGFGRFLTGSTGEYYFRTIKPVPYPGRTPHIHFGVNAGKAELVTQMYVAGEPQNDRDFLYRRLRDRRARAAVTVRLDPANGIEADALAGTFDIVMRT